MPEHLHGVLLVTQPLRKPLGELLRGFKIGATKIAREMGILAADAGHGEVARGRGLFADGFTDTILGDEAALRKGIAYMQDNSRRLAVKRANPHLFRVVRDLCLPIHGQGSLLPIHGQEEAHFMAIGNRALLSAPHILQVQVSRSEYSQARDGQAIDGLARCGLARDGHAKSEAVSVAADVVVRGGVRGVGSAAFEEKAARLLAAASHGAVLISPCISEGEREICRRAYDAGHKVIALCNKGFSRLYKPGGRLFDLCAAGNLLLMAPAAWPYVPGKKPITRIDACILNRIAQMIAGDGAAEINYKGITPNRVDDLVAAVLMPRQ